MISFVKGHMGGNEIILLSGDQIPKGKEISWSLLALLPPGIRGHQTGLFYRLKYKNRVKVKIVSVSGKNFISSCGGLTQVFGKALLETNFNEFLGLEIHNPITEVFLETDAGVVPIKIEYQNGNVTRVTTSMKPFIKECYRLGTRSTEVANINAIKVGRVLVVNSEQIVTQYPDTNFEKIDKLTLQTLWKIHKDFLEKEYPNRTSGDFAVYDLNPTGNGNGRVIFPHYIPEGHIEPACGTGTIAVGIAMVENGDIKTDTGEAEISFESGGSPFMIGGPDLTKVELKIKNKRVIEGSFSHSVVDILATGKIWI